MMGRKASRTFGADPAQNTVFQLILGSCVVILVGYLGILVAPVFGLTAFWPFAGLWAALGWGIGRVSLKPVFALIMLGLLTDLSFDAPLGCWVSIHLLCYMLVSMFQKRANVDKTGMVRLLAVVVALLGSFLFARWIMGAFLGGMSTTVILGGFLSASLLYLPVRPIFLLKTYERPE